MEILISRIRDEARVPKYQSVGAGCFDLEALDELTIRPGETAAISTGLVIKIPEGYFLAIAPRSSNARLGLIMPHSIGIIDSDYSGEKDEIKILLTNISNQGVQIKKYQRIAQGFIVDSPRVIWKETPSDQLSSISRGGFGSTGR